MDDAGLVREIAKNKAWSEGSARLCLAAKFKCEYCGLDFLESPIAYKQIQFDHIVPKTAGGSDSEENLAAACRTCNWDWKGQWNPAKAVPSGGRPDLVAACQQYIRDRQGPTAEEIRRIRSIIHAAPAQSPKAGGQV